MEITYSSVLVFICIGNNTAELAMSWMHQSELYKHVYYMIGLFVLYISCKD